MNVLYIQLAIHSDSYITILTYKDMHNVLDIYTHIYIHFTHQTIRCVPKN
uniref:Uncharacterized protein n=1 Tax=Octopus bimaculoides TaxID=37653 RepID=A0A0L8HKB7_OCTBM